jgi:hypothetical protein
MFERITRATRAVPANAPPVERLRASLRTFFAFLAKEPEFARAFIIEVLAAGPRALERRTLAHQRYAALHRAWHRRARLQRPDWPVLPDEAYQAMVGAIYELAFSYVRAGRTAELPRLEAIVLPLLLAVFSGSEQVS